MNNRPSTKRWIFPALVAASGLGLRMSLGPAALHNAWLPQPGQVLTHVIDPLVMLVTFPTFALALYYRALHLAWDQFLPERKKTDWLAIGINWPLFTQLGQSLLKFVLIVIVFFVSVRQGLGYPLVGQFPGWLGIALTLGIVVCVAGFCVELQPRRFRIGPDQGWRVFHRHAVGALGHWNDVGSAAKAKAEH